MMAAIVTATGLALTASTFPATAATGSRDLTTATGSSSTTSNSTTSNSTNSTNSTAGDTTVATTGRTLSYDEGAAGYCTWWAIHQFHAYTGLYPDLFDPANDGDAQYWATNA